MGLQVPHTADLEPAVLQAARALLDEAFDGDFSDHDGEHSLGGVHALVWDGPDLVGHAALVARRLLHGGRVTGPPSSLAAGNSGADRPRR